jgi:uncharacterized protein
MDFILDNGNAAFQIKSYSKGIIKVNERDYSCPILISPGHLLAPWGPSSWENLSLKDFQIMLAYKPKVVLLGTGEKLCFPPLELFASLYAQQIGVEIMDTKAACRTYTVLMAEGRAVVAGLFS